jgi:hypothetical protein
VNSAYGNSPLRCELTRDDPRPPEGGINSVGITQSKDSFQKKAVLCFIACAAQIHYLVVRISP